MTTCGDALELVQVRVHIAPPVTGANADDARGLVKVEGIQPIGADEEAAFDACPTWVGGVPSAAYGELLPKEFEHFQSSSHLTRG